MTGDDLISRAAALDVINTWGRQKSEKVRMGLLHRDLDAIPAVDAIPVEWLMKVLAEANEFPIVERETIVAIPYLVKRWQKEQEART